MLTTLGVIIGVGAVIAMMEIGQGSKAALEATIASMGANTMMVQSGAAASGGVSFGMGSTPTLTSQDGEQILRQCPAVANVAPLVSARTQVIYGHKNWVPMFICGTTPSYLAIRDWERLDEGECFTDNNVRQSNKVCLIGQTLVRELFGGQSPIGREIRMQNVSMRVVGVLEKKGANMVGMDQDDLVLAPWTTIKYRVSGTTLTNTNQSAALAAASSLTAINTLSNLYPGSTALYAASSPLQQADLPSRSASPTSTSFTCRPSPPTASTRPWTRSARSFAGNTISGRKRTTTSTSATWPRPSTPWAPPRA